MTTFLSTLRLTYLTRGVIVVWGKSRSRFGKWLDSHREEYNQLEFGEAAGVSKDTITKACSDDSFIPSAIVMRKVMAVVKRIDPGKRSSDFWDV